MEFSLYNTMSREKEPLHTVLPGHAGIYSCGPTVHNRAHIGNLRKYILDDVLAKSLRLAGYDVLHVMNITDVGHLESDADEGEDKMLLSAEREHTDVYSLARHYENLFFEDCGKLNIRRPDICCRATEHIGAMIALIETLERKGFTYCAGGNVYFDISKSEGYGRLARLETKDLLAGSRVEVDPYKRAPGDFALWFTNSKFKNQAMQWPSPWGRGYPGWHIECSAMALHYLGERLDIHTGGTDHIPVHHTNEIAQSETAIGHAWVTCWVHSAMLLLEGGKMSKSAGGFLTLEALSEKGFTPMDYRFFCLSSRYRQQLAFSYESLQNAQSALQSLVGKLSAALADSFGDVSLSQKAQEYEQRFLSFLADDLNLPNALTLLFDVLKDPALSSSEKVALAKSFDTVLGLDLLQAAQEKNTPTASAEVEELIAKRSEAKRAKDYAAADNIRRILAEMNIELNDTPEGTRWSQKS